MHVNGIIVASRNPRKKKRREWNGFIVVDGLLRIVGFVLLFGWIFIDFKFLQLVIFIVWLDFKFLQLVVYVVWFFFYGQWLYKSFLSVQKSVR